MAETFGASRDVIEDLTVDEDCLYLNIWTPTMTPDAPLPVMVYVHGGSNKSGWSYEQNYHGQALAERGVVVVSIAYRVRRFRLPVPSGTAACLSRSQLRSLGSDWRAAVDTAAYRDCRFGGDPQRVTAFGESAGAEDILALMFAEPAQGLCSPAQFCRAPPDSALTMYRRFPGEQQRGVRAWRACSASMAITSSSSYGQCPPKSCCRPTRKHLQAITIRPPSTVNSFLSQIWNRIADSDFGDYEVIIGTNANEWYDTVGAGVTIAVVERGANGLNHIDSEAALQAVAGESDPQYALDRLHTADEMLCPSQYLAAKLTESDHDAWMYFFFSCS